MRKSLLSLLLAPLSLIVATTRHVADVIVEWRPGTWDPIPYKLAWDTPVEVRRDLLAPQPITLSAPTQRATRAQRDQRPSLRAFTLQQNKLAF